MNAPTRQTDFTGLVSVSDAAEDLQRIHAACCGAAVWTRMPDPLMQAWLHNVADDLLPKGRVVVRPAAVRSAVEAICEASSTPEGPGRAAYIDDIAAMADRFAGVMSAPWLRVRLDRVDTNACRRFHIDALRCRLVCTYRGTGTQYGVAQRGSEPEHIFSVPTGAPILLRGTAWPVEAEVPLLHRSPPIEGTGEVRSVLVLDPMEQGHDDI